MPGTSITISSPVLVSGTMTGVTDAAGVYRFPSLVPGTYSVKLELQGFQSILGENVAVLVGQTTPVELQMKVATVAETVTVTGAVAGRRHDQRQQARQPQRADSSGHARRPGHLGARRIQGAGPRDEPSGRRRQVGRPSGHLQCARHQQRQNSQFLNGVNVGDPAAIGAAGYYYDNDSFDDIQVSTGAHDITVPTGGVFLNMVTKSGGNTLGGGRNTFAWEASRRRARTSTRTC